MNLKKVIGAGIGLLFLVGCAILILRIWGIEIIDAKTLINSNLTLLVLGFMIVILIVLYGLFFKNNEKDYDRTTGNRAHPKKQD